ncbi:hypothetical protein SDC9_176475 [bioreactor metagenome]|uniref:Uncharacterized protein n=1 Tax=bioreactor metagenome TaxID=1076179 RepID=A0A645GQ66_9ZZZZ
MEEPPHLLQHAGYGLFNFSRAVVLPQRLADNPGQGLLKIGLRIDLRVLPFLGTHDLRPGLYLAEYGVSALARILCLTKSVTAMLKQRLAVPAMPRSQRKAHTARYLSVGFPHHVFARLQELAHAADRGGLRGNRRHKYQECISADAGNDITVPEYLAEEAGQFHQYRVAENVGILIVHAAKIVHIHQQHGGIFIFTHLVKVIVNTPLSRRLMI